MCVAKVRNAQWNAAKRGKAFAYAYMAASADPQNRFGPGVAQGIWNRDPPAFQPLRAFVERLRTVGGMPEAAPT